MSTLPPSRIKPSPDGLISAVSQLVMMPWFKNAYSSVRYGDDAQSDPVPEGAFDSGPGQCPGRRGKAHTSATAYDS